MKKYKFNKYSFQNFLFFSVTILLVSFFFLSTIPIFAKTSTFSYRDVPSRHWARSSVEFLNKNKIFPNKKYFKGTSNALRYDIFLSTDRLLNFFEAYKGIRIKRGINFSDMPASKDAQNSILRLSGLEFVKGSSKGKLQGMKNVTRYEAAAFFYRIVKFFKLKPLKKKSKNFSDLPSRHWASNSVKNLTRFSIINGYKNSTFNGNGNISRYELAIVLKKVADLFLSKNAKTLKNNGEKKEQSKPLGRETLPWISKDKLFKIVNKCANEKRKYKYGTWDCSKFVQYVFANQSIKLPRTSSDQSKSGRPVEIADLRPGDLLFFNYKDNTNKITHSAIYLGKKDKIQCAFAHNSWSAKRVVVTDLAKEYYLSKLICARRVALVK